MCGTLCSRCVVNLYLSPRPRPASCKPVDGIATTKQSPLFDASSVERKREAGKGAPAALPIGLIVFQPALLKALTTVAVDSLTNLCHFFHPSHHLPHHHHHHLLLHTTRTSPRQRPGSSPQSPLLLIWHIFLIPHRLLQPYGT